MNKIPTVEEFYEIKSKELGYTNFLEFIEEHQDTKIKILLFNWSLEFTKFHVQAALKEAAEKAEVITCDEHGQDVCNVNEQSILNAYPLTNIK